MPHRLYLHRGLTCGVEDDSPHSWLYPLDASTPPTPRDQANNVCRSCQKSPGWGGWGEHTLGEVEREGGVLAVQNKSHGESLAKIIAG